MDATTKTRSISAIAALSLLLPVLIWGGIVGFGVLLLAVLVISAGEVISLGRERPWTEQLYKEYGMGMFYALMLLMMCIVTLLEYRVVFSAMMLLVVVVVAIQSFGVHFGRQKRLMTDERVILLLVWVFPGIISLLWIRQFEQGLLWIIYLLLVAFGSDMGGYFAGRKWGKRKLAPTISQKKTVEGAIGALVSGSLLAFMFGIVAGLERNPLLLAFLSVGLSASAIVGDLLESVIKRRFGMKDSGGLIPGHGGILDRLDSIIFVAVLLNFVLQVSALIGAYLTG